MGSTNGTRAGDGTSVIAVRLCLLLLVRQLAPVSDSGFLSKGYPMQRQHCG
jgi:hypothetical protein